MLYALFMPSSSLPRPCNQCSHAMRESLCTFNEWDKNNPINHIATQYYARNPQESTIIIVRATRRRIFKIFSE
jgi:hypothetical protein